MKNLTLFLSIIFSSLTLGSTPIPHKTLASTSCADNIKNCVSKNTHSKYAGLTTSPKGLPNDSRILINGITSNPIKPHYLDNAFQLRQIDENVSYLNCGKSINPTSSFHLNLSSFIDQSDISKNDASNYLKNCSGRVLISVAHYIKPGSKCQVRNKFYTGQKSTQTITSSIIKGGDITTKSDITPSTPGYDFSILKTGKTKSGDTPKVKGLPICDYVKDACPIAPKLILPHIMPDKKFGANSLPGKGITAQCSIVDRVESNSDKYVSSQSNYIKHSCDALPGASGAPLLNLSCNKLCVEGVQNIGLKESNSDVKLYNKALDIKSPLFNSKMKSFLKNNCSIPSDD